MHAIVVGKFPTLEKWRAATERAVWRCVTSRDDDVRTSGSGAGMMPVGVVHHKARKLCHVCEAALCGKRTEVDRAVPQTHLQVNRHAVRTRHRERRLEAEVLMEPAAG